MIIRPTPVVGAHVIELASQRDERGFFARTWCRREFQEAGVDVEMVQASISYNHHAGTIRGLHFTWPPSDEGKLVRCERGRVFDVIVDLRPESASFLSHFALELDEHRGNALYIPVGVAHGFQTLVDDCVVYYMMTDYYRSEHADGVRYDDPAFGIAWPREVNVIAQRDRNYPSFDVQRHASHYATALGGN